MQKIEEIRFIAYDKIDESQETRWPYLFGKLEAILKEFDLLPEIANLTKDRGEMVITVEKDFDQDMAQAMLARLKSIFRVTHYEYDLEPDDWYGTKPHVAYGFYEK